jgi:hypothetical protein
MQIWDRFFDFACPPNDELSRAEVQAKLSALGIDVIKQMSRIEQALQTVQAKEALAAAKERRPRLVETIRSIAAEAGESVREQLRRLIGERVQGELQAAYFRKLEAAASDDDLQSLLDDMCRLEAMEKESDDGTPRG